MEKAISRPSMVHSSHVTVGHWPEKRETANLQIVEEQVLKFLVLLESLGDVTKEDGLDDATSSPHGSDTGVLE